MKKVAILLLFCLATAQIKIIAVEPLTTKIILSEGQKIDKIYEYLAALKDAKFYRNGSYYDVTDAISHLKMKQGKVGSGANTARNFIYNVATKSSMSGNLYKIKFSDGTELELKDVLLKKLNEIEAGK